MYVSAIVLAAGRSLRMAKGVSKPLVKIDFLPVIIYSLRALEKNPSVGEILVVVNAQNRAGIIQQIKREALKKISVIVLGGKLRQDSALSGLDAINDQANLILIHDAARPFINQEIIRSVIGRAARCGAAIVGVPVKATIKQVTKSQSHQVTSRYVKNTLDREELWEIQTPQVFKKELILEAYRKYGKKEVTDDAMLVEKLGKKVAVVMGSYNNIKITTPEDLVIAEAIAKKYNFLD